ncbi:MAG: hypothetical protein KJO08_07115 [Gammaproteobacteria bacterium]|nr:hypothetical protein [Gammaproteobacteria bacterium]NNJ84903.1 hypothetical protein [Gammaproteobacteria bacterium]
MHKETNRTARAAGGYFGLLSLEPRIMFDGAGAADAASETTITSSESSYSYTEQAPAIPIDDITITSEHDYRGGSLFFTLDGSTDSDQLNLINKPGANVNAEGVISVDGDNVYLGNGEDRALIGIIDADNDGQDGASLRIDFTENFSHGDFESDDLITNLRDSGWVIPTNEEGNGLLVLGSDQICEYPIPYEGDDGYQMPSDSIGEQLTSSSDTSREHWYIGENTQSRPSNESSFDATNSLHLGSQGIVTRANLTTVHGPYACSNEIYLAQGDVVSFDWAADRAIVGDSYDVFAYLLNTETGDTEVLLNRLGSAPPPPDSLAYTEDVGTAETIISESGDYRVIFVSGSYDSTGATLAGASFYIDNLAAGSLVDGTVLTTIASQLTFSNDSDTPPDDPRDLTISITPDDSIDPDASLIVEIDIDPVNDPPVLTVPASITVEANEEYSLSNVRVDDPDVDELDEIEMEIEITAPDVGNLQFSADIDALIVSGQNNSTSVTLEGTLADINNALETLSFITLEQIPEGTQIAEIRYEVNDRGNTGPMGTPTEEIEEKIEDETQILRLGGGTLQPPEPDPHSDQPSESINDFPTIGMVTTDNPSIDVLNNPLPITAADRGSSHFTQGGSGNSPIMVSDSGIMSSARSIATRGAESAPAAAMCYGSDGDVLAVNRGIENMAIEVGRRFEFQVPYDTFTHTNSEAEIQLKARQIDGSPLPDWFRFNSEAGILAGMVPNAPAQEVITVEIIARDVSSGCEVTTSFSFCLVDDGTKECQIEPTEEWELEEWEEESMDDDISHTNQNMGIQEDGRSSAPADRPICRSAFSEQLAAAGRTGFEARQAAFIATISAHTI